ncbi:CX module family protein [Brugia pahangi]|uniref:CX domain-containing protein n=1 Tax=Brugia pahangi TaxID=6280 RepID=A0A0N4TIW2_BRUPA|nr:unnamed protein product [Brugia pahangi]
MNIQRFLPVQLSLLVLVLLLLFVIKECGSKRSGTFTGGRGISASRSSGLFGGLRKNGGGSSGNPRGSRWGMYGGGNIGKTSGGRWGSSSHSTSWGQRRGGSLFTKSNIGSFVAGAAAGYLTYKAGKALIRRAHAPMMWNNRPYYWGSNYYRGDYGTHMCRVPIQGDDPQLGNVYFDDGRKPKELVWSCNYDEYCCGYDCCRNDGTSSYWRNAGFGNILLVSLAIVHFI